MPPGVMLKEFPGYRSQTGKHSIKSTKFIIYYGGSIYSAGTGMKGVSVHKESRAGNRL